MGWLLSLWDRWVPWLIIGYSRSLADPRLVVPAAVDGPQIASAAVPAKDDYGIPGFGSVVTSLSLLPRLGCGMPAV